MMRLRAAAALLFQLLLLEVSVLGGGMACAPEWLGVVSRVASHDAGAHDPASHHAAAHGPTGAHGGHSAHGDAHGAVAKPPADAPAPGHGTAPAHCAAAAGCAAVLVDAPEVITASVAAVHASVQVGRVSLPLSTNSAPEPPPPRA